MEIGLTPSEDKAFGTFFSSFEDKYALSDNLDADEYHLIKDRPALYNYEYVFLIVVTEGTVNFIIDGDTIQVNENDHLSIMPCVTVEVKESKGKFFSYITKCHLIDDIFEHTHIGNNEKVRAFCYRHYTMSEDLTKTLLHTYLLSKKEHMRPNYPMKETVIRALKTAFVSQLYSLVSLGINCNSKKPSKQSAYFDAFLEKLREHHKTERSVQFYASILNITPKYLSAISQEHTGFSASQVIDQYVIFAIKQALYSNESNIKNISSQFNFPTQSFFGRYFKRITGISPNEYIKNNNRKSLSFSNNA